MIHVRFDQLRVGRRYTRPDLASTWGYRAYQAIARGVVTPAHGGVIVLFVTEEKQQDMHQYADRLDGRTLYWEGPTDHFAEDRILAAHVGQDAVHVFHRHRHHEPFTYLGRADVAHCERTSGRPSRFVLQLVD